MNSKFTVMLALVLSILFLNTLSAQGITGKGIRVGVNMASVIGDDIPDGIESLIGLTVGGFTTYQINEKLSIQPELLYSMKGAKRISSVSEMGYELEQEISIAMNYLEIPIFGVLSLQKNIKLLAGPYVGIYIDGEASFESTLTYEGETESESDSEKIDADEINSPEFGFILGAEYSLGQISLGARYSLALTNFPDPDEEMQNTVMQIILGFTF